MVYKKYFKSVLKKLILSKAFDFIFYPFFKILILKKGILKLRHLEFEFENLKNEFPNITNPLVVKNGPMKGMLYPSLISVGSELLPKLIGCYEMELWPFWDKVRKKDYKIIIDIGCAEGYYAVGLALLYKSAIVFAYDISANARKKCLEMGLLNCINDRLFIEAKFSQNEFYNFDYTNKTLIVCDCEGFELQLFNGINPHLLSDVDLLIETHDFVNLEISTKLKSLFSMTHNVFSVKSIDDIEKALKYSFFEIDHLNLNQKKIVLSENRPTIMEWIICLSK